MAIITAGLVIILLAILIAPVANQTTGQTTQRTLTTSNPPNPTSCNSNWAYVNGAIAGGVSAGEKSVGVSSTAFQGRTFTSISFYLCSLSTDAAGSFTNVCPIISTATITFGIISATTGSVIQSFGTIALSSIPCVLATNLAGQTSAQITITGNHVIQSGEMVGIAFSAAKNVTTIMCAGTCLGNELPDGSIVDCKASCTASSGFSLAGTFVYSSISNQNVTSSPGIVQVLPLYPLVFAGFGLVLVWVTGTGKKGERGV